MRHRRSGVTLIEVLTAIFITGIGLLALLTLFPLGAMNMAQAIRDDRVGHVKENALAIALMHDVHNDPLPTTYMRTPGGGLAPIPTGYTGASYPVLVDPLGDRYNTGNFQGWLAGDVGTGRGMRRCGASFLTPGLSSDPAMNPTTNPGGYLTRRNQQLLRWCTMLDELDFETEGPYTAQPKPISATPLQFERTTNFSWAWLIRQERVGDPKTLEVQAVIYHRRPLLPNVGEAAYDATVDPTVSTFTLTWDPNTQDRPNVKLGGWLLDATASPLPRGVFYRIVSIVDLGTNALQVEVQTRPNVQIVGSTARVIVMDGVVEVTSPYRPEE